MSKKYCGYISIIGKPNVGKSTIINSILEKKVSITSRKSQTTRNNILGVKTVEKKDLIVFLAKREQLKEVENIFRISSI